MKHTDERTHCRIVRALLLSYGLFRKHKDCEQDKTHHCPKRSSIHHNYFSSRHAWARGKSSIVEGPAIRYIYAKEQDVKKSLAAKTCCFDPASRGFFSLRDARSCFA